MKTDINESQIQFTNRETDYVISSCCLIILPVLPTLLEPKDIHKAINHLVRHFTAEPHLQRYTSALK